MKIPTPLSERDINSPELPAAIQILTTEWTRCRSAYVDFDVHDIGTRFRLFVQGTPTPGVVALGVVGAGADLIGIYDGQPLHPDYLLGKVTDNRVAAEVIAHLINMAFDPIATLAANRQPPTSTVG